MHIVHCGVNPAQFNAVQHAGQGKRLLFVGRLANVKGVPVLLKALSAISKDRPELTLSIAGDGPDRAGLEAQAKQLGIAQNVKFLGYQSQSQVRELLQQTDVFVLPSFAEGVPVVLMEAMAAGVPVVTTRIAGVPELVDDGVSGILTPPGDEVALGSAIATLLDDPTRRATMGEAGREKVAAEFDINKEAAWLCEVMSGALSGQVLPIRPAQR
jgi:glycosyltransferase involved in cell wall biosynthesis